MNIKQAYDFGVDYAKSGANTTNCNYSIFSQPEYLKAWDEGRKSVKKVTIRQDSKGDEKK
jgi:hypothetical protein